MLFLQRYESWSQRPSIESRQLPLYKTFKNAEFILQKFAKPRGAVPLRRLKPMNPKPILNQYRALANQTSSTIYQNEASAQKRGGRHRQSPSRVRHRLLVVSSEIKAQKGGDSLQRLPIFKEIVRKTNLDVRNHIRHQYYRSQFFRLKSLEDMKDRVEFERSAYLAP